MHISRNAFYALASAIALTVTGWSTALAAPDLDRLKSALGGIEPDAVNPTPIDGLFEVILGSQILYLTEDGRYVIQGKIVDLSSAKDLTETRAQSLRADQLAQLDAGEMIIFSPPGEVKHSVIVFTDIDCGYCRKLHQEIPAYHRLGIEIRYLAFPRAGKQSESFNKAVAAWCASDPHRALTMAKNGQAIPPAQCENPVASHFDLGQALGVRGTPSIFLANGQMVPGYVPAERLLQMIEGEVATN